MKAAPLTTITTTQQQQQSLSNKQLTIGSNINITTNNAGNSTTNLHTNSAINAIVSSIMNSANQWQQQQKKNCNYRRVYLISENFKSSYNNFNLFSF